MPVLMDHDGQVAQSYGVQGIPQTVIIHNGKIVRVHVGFSPNMAEILKADIEPLLADDKDKK
jgi:thioredoxin-like negative regulator of GroEL